MMSDIITILKVVRPPTTPFINEETFPSAIEMCPALAHIAASGLRSKDFDEGFMSAMSAIFDAAGEEEYENNLAPLTIDKVAAIDALIMTNKDFASQVIEQLPHIARYLKTKANADFKAGVLLAMASAAFGHEVPDAAEEGEVEHLDTTPLTEATPITEEEIVDVAEPNMVRMPLTTVVEKNIVYSKEGPITNMLIAIRKTFPTANDITMSINWTDTFPYATINVELGKTIPFDRIAEAVAKVRDILPNEVYIGTKDGDIVIEIVV
jgi:hypothetical protein